MKADLSPTGRALRVLELLQAHPGITASQLATQLGVTERAARRYVEILREADIPVESARGPYGGYRLGHGIRLPPLVFSATEALGLVMAVLDGSHAAADADDPVGAALGKIIRALPENIGHQAAAMRQHACAAPDRAAARPGMATTSALVTAIAARRRVSIGYRSESGHQWTEEADPWAVIVRHGRWYLLCHSHRAGAVRAYRIDRIQSVAGGSEQFQTPKDLDYVDLLEQHLGTGWQFETKVVFDAPCREAARYVGPPMGRLSPIDDGARCVLTGTTSNPAMYAGEWLAAIPIPFHVTGGPELRAAVAAVTERLAAALSAAPATERLASNPARSSRQRQRPGDRCHPLADPAGWYEWGMAGRLLLVHSPLVGSVTWDLVSAELARAGYELNVPDLTGTVSAGPPYCVRQAQVIATSAAGQPAILIGHSGAGPLLAAAGAMIGEGVRGYIFVDAGLPTPGQAWMETVPPELAAQVREMADAEGSLPPWPLWWGEEAMTELLPDPSVRRLFVAGCPRLPLAMFEEIQPAVPLRPDAPAAYLQLSEAYEHEAAAARELGWPVAQVMSHHLAMLTEPSRVAGSLHDLLGLLS